MATYRTGTGVSGAYLVLLFTICFLGNASGGAISTMMSVYLPVLVSDLLGDVGEGQFNQVSSLINALYFAGWTIGGLTWGLIGDRAGRVKSLAMTVGVFGLFALMTSLVSDWVMVMIFRFLCGFGIGGMMVISTTLLAEVWPERSRAIFIGIASIGFPIGIISSGAVNYLVPNWRHGFLSGILPVGISLMALGFLKESEKWKYSRPMLGEKRDRQGFSGHKQDLLNGSVIFGSMLIGMWAVFSWVPSWIQGLLAGGGGQHERGLAMMTMGAGGLAGGFVSGWIANVLGVRRALMVSFLSCFILSLLLFRFNTGFSGVVLAELALIAFMFGISQGIFSFYIPLLFPVSVRATATGFCYNTGRVLTTAAVFSVGILVPALGGYGGSLFAFSFVFLLGFLFLAISNHSTQ